MTPLIIFTAQLIMVFFKHIAIRAIAQHKVWHTLFYTFIIQSSWLVSSALGINALLNKDWTSVSAYIIGGVLGSYLQFKIKMKDKS